VETKKHVKEKNMNKKEMVAKVAEKCESTKKEASMMIDAVIGTIKETLVSGEKVSLVGFGSFDAVLRAERQCTNFQSGEKMTVPAKFATKFKASKNLKSAVAELPVD
jgi:DNA-binding protein HU-beta